jgi:catalase
MQRSTIIRLAVTAALLATSSAWAEDKPVTEQLVDTLTTLAGGPHKGYRANHAKGVMVEGTFTPTAQAAGISSAPHFKSGPTAVLVRYSDATGVPNIPDANGNAFPKGIAIRFKLPR